MITDLGKFKDYLSVMSHPSENDLQNDKLLSLLLNKAEQKVLNRRHPFGYNNEEAKETAERHSQNILQIATYIYDKRKAGHYDIKIPESYLSDIVPMTKVI